MAKSIRLLTAVARHGDRAPVLLASEGHSTLSRKETEYWTSALVDKDLQPSVNNANLLTFDQSTYPLGNLTRKGAQQCHERGKRLAARYASAGISLHPSRVRVRASNYRRTQLSAHYLTNGLVHAADAFKPAITVGPSATCGIAAFESDIGLMKATKDLFRTDLYQSRERSLSHISRALCEAIPYFAHTPGLQQAATTPSSTSSPSAPVIHKVLIGDDGTAGSRWMWIRCADVYMTHRSHAMGELLNSYVHGHHGPIEHFEDLVHEHLLWRFRTLFTQPHILPLAIGPLLKDLQAAMHSAVAGDLRAPTAGALEKQQSVPMDVIGGHDVTLQPLLYALCLHGQGHGGTRTDADAASQQHGRSTQGTEYERLHAQMHKGVLVHSDSGRKSWIQSPSALVHAIGWPRYASCVSFEVHTPPPPSSQPTPTHSGRAVEGAKDTIRETLVKWRWDNEELPGESSSAIGASGTGAQARTAGRQAIAEGETDRMQVSEDAYLEWAGRARHESAARLPKLGRPDRACYMEGVMSLATFDQMVRKVMHG